MIRLLHLADLHPQNGLMLGGKLLLDEKSGQNLTLTDMERSLAAATEVALDEQTRCDAVVIAGDLWDTPRPHANEIRVIRTAVAKLAERIPVIAIAGNHDISQNPNDATALESLKDIKDVWVFESPASMNFRLKGETVRFSMLPYPTRARLQAMTDGAMSPEEMTAIINKALAAILQRFALDMKGVGLHVLVAHGSVINATVGEQPRSLQNDILIPTEYFDPFDYIALGHIHKAQQVHENGYYCGSLMRQSFGEETDAKSFNLVTLECDVRKARVTLIPNENARTYKTLTVTQATDLLKEPSFTDWVYRIKDEVSAEFLASANVAIRAFQEAHPLTQVDLTVVKENRVRDAKMNPTMTAEEALTRILADKVTEDDMPALLNKHRLLTELVGV